MDEGWGVLEAEELPGGCWAHVSAIDAEDCRGLEPGAAVALWWSRVQQGSHPFRADRVLPAAGPGYAAPISDADVVSALRALRTPDVEVVTVERLGPSTALLRFTALASGEEWAFELSLPSSMRLKPWLYRTPDDANDAAVMLGIFLDEEVVTTAVRTAARDGAGLLILAPYGFQQSDPREHDRIQAIAGADGFHGRQTEAGLLDFDDPPRSTWITGEGR